MLSNKIPVTQFSVLSDINVLDIPKAAFHAFPLCFTLFLCNLIGQQEVTEALRTYFWDSKLVQHNLRVRMNYAGSVL